MPDQALEDAATRPRTAARHHPPPAGLLRRHQPVEGELDLADALDLDAAMTRGAEQLRLAGSTESLDVRRPSPPASSPATSSPSTSTPTTTPGPTTSDEAPPGRPLRAPLRGRDHWHQQRSELGPGGEPPPRRHRRPGPHLVRQPRHHRHGQARHRPQRAPPCRRLRDPRPPRRTDPATHSTCVFPWCTRPARTADCDHVIPYAEGGTTCSCNIAALCADDITDSRPIRPGPTPSSNPGPSCGPAPTATSSSATTPAPSTSPPTDTPVCRPTHPTSSRTAPTPADPTRRGHRHARRSVNAFTRPCERAIEPPDPVFSRRRVSRRLIPAHGAMVSTSSTTGGQGPPSACPRSARACARFRQAQPPVARARPRRAPLWFRQAQPPAVTVRPRRAPLGFDKLNHRRSRSALGVRPLVSTSSTTGGQGPPSACAPWFRQAQPPVVAVQPRRTAQRIRRGPATGSGPDPQRTRRTRPSSQTGPADS